MTKLSRAVCRLRFCFLLYLLSSLLSFAETGGGKSGLVFPLGPADLLALLPVAPENWKLTVSSGEKRLSFASAPESYATREYLYVPPPPPAGVPPEPNAPPETVRVTLMDTGNNPDRMSLFEGFKIEKEQVAPGGGKYLNLLLEGLPATKFQKDQFTLVTVAVSPRFLLTVRMINVDQSRRDQWMKIVQVTKLAEASNRAPYQHLTSGMVTMECIDELNPKANFKSQVNVVTDADLERINRTSR